MGSGNSKGKTSSASSPSTTTTPASSTQQATTPPPTSSPAASSQQTTTSAKAPAGSTQEASSVERPPATAGSPQGQTAGAKSSSAAGSTSKSASSAKSGSGSCGTQQPEKPASPPAPTVAATTTSQQQEGAGDSTPSAAPCSSSTHNAQSGSETNTDKGDTGTGDKERAGAKAETDKEDTPPRSRAMAEESVLASVPEHQLKFDTALRATNALVKQDGLLGAANDKVKKLSLRRALPEHVSLGSLLPKLSNLEVLDVSGNQLGPQGVRTLCMALPASSTLASLCVADNKGDTDTAESVGHLLSHGPPLVYLDVSGNYLGKDFFSRSAGQALKTNTTLQTLRAQSIGMVDAAVLLEGLKENKTLVEIDLSSNHMADRGKALGSTMAEILKRPDCCLQSLSVGGCNMANEGLKSLCAGFAANSSLREFNVSNNEFGSLQTLLELVAVASTHPSLQNLHANDAKVTDKSVADLTLPATDCQSTLHVLSLHSSNVTDDFFARLAAACKGRLLCLLDVDVSNGAELTPACVKSLWTMTADADGKSNLRKLTAAMNDMDGLPATLTSAMFPHLSYLNVRRARLSADGFSSLPGLVSPSGLPLATLVLDGLKLSGRPGLSALFDNCSSSPLKALSLSGCSLTDADLSPLIKAVGSGFKVHMLKMSENRLTDSTLSSLAETLLNCPSHPLSVLDVSGNQMTQKGVEALCSLYTNKKHASSLHSLNLTGNSIGKEGVLSLVSCMGGKFPLTCLYVNNQSASYLESDVDEIYAKVASVLGYTIKRSGETIEKGCSALPSLPDGLFINMRGLGGHIGELGPFLDCPAILTDASIQQHRPLTLENALEICATLQGRKDGNCVMSSDDWNHISGAKKDNSIPSWLQLADGRTKGVYLSNLPGNSTSQRLEALFEMEADCNIDEVFLVKDPVTRNNSGTAWVLFSDEASVERAMDFYRSGQAQVFGTAFIVSRIQVTIEDAVATGASAKAREDLVARQRARAAEDRAHRQLIQQNTEESWKRHAYRLAHPAYADGRIW